MTRFRFFQAGCSDALSELAMSIDGAIDTAKRLSRERARQILVMAEDGPQKVARGVARAGVWRWCVACAKCGGKGKHGAGKAETTCPRCDGAGWVEGVTTA